MFQVYVYDKSLLKRMDQLNKQLKEEKKINVLYELHVTGEA